MRTRTFVWSAGILAVAMVLAGACGSSSSKATVTTTATTSNAPVKLTIFAAGTLANPFNAIDKAFSANYPNVTLQPQFGGSVKEVKQVTELGQQADVVGVADYSVIPKYMFGAGGKTRYANWYIGFVTNAITFVYTSKSKGASQITPQNWYTVLAEPGVQIGRSNPDTDPSGYQTLQMLKLAETFYGKPGLSDAILKNAPQKNIRDTETELIGALEAGQIDYLAIYRSDALQHHLKYLDLPADINLSDASKAAAYKTAVVHTANGALTAAPIIYALTIPTNAAHADWGLKWLEFALGPEGRKVMSDAGFGIVSPALANNPGAVPAALQGLVIQWPGQ
ncbi:MAG: extracellular solute-binding protein [Dehalococcoidia bacterium]